MIRLIVPAIACGLALAGCATDADDWGGSPQAAKTLASCRAQSNGSPAMVNAQRSPFFAAAMQQQYINDCMAAFGYRQR